MKIAKGPAEPRAEAPPPVVRTPAWPLDNALIATSIITHSVLMMV